MATVTGYTAARMKAIEDGTVVDGEIIGDDLILTKFDGTQINAGAVVGPQGPTGPQGPAGDSSFAGYVEPLNDLGNVSGTVTLDFSTHNVWRINPTAAVTIAFSNLPLSGNVAPGTLIVANDSYAVSWPAATKFPNDEPPIIKGETIISMLARPTEVTVGAAWTAVL